LSNEIGEKIRTEDVRRKMGDEKGKRKKEKEKRKMEDIRRRRGGAQKRRMVTLAPGFLFD